MPRTTVVTCAYPASPYTAAPVGPEHLHLRSAALAAPSQPRPPLVRPCSWPSTARGARFTVLERASPGLSARATKMKFVVPLLPCCMCSVMLFVFVSSSERASCVARALRVHGCPPCISARMAFSLALDLGLDDIHRCAFPALVLTRAWNVTCP